MNDRVTVRVEIRRLGDIAEILPGFSTGTSLQHDVDGSHQVVLSRHLTPGLPYTYREEDEFRIDVGSLSARARFDARSRTVSRYELRPGDVLFMSRGTRNLATRIEWIAPQTIAPVSFFILRFRERDLFQERDANDSAYLTWYLNTIKAQNDIANIRTGAGTPIVQRAPFGELEIPLPDHDTQRRIGALGELMVHERILRERLNEASARANDSASDALARRLIGLGHQSSGDSA
jgi:hypothetical protein